MLGPQRGLEGVPGSCALAKYAVAGSSDQRNTIWGTVEWEGDRDGTDGAFVLVVREALFVSRDRSDQQSALSHQRPSSSLPPPFKIFVNGWPNVDLRLYL
jgi:hypothetical protein